MKTVREELSAGGVVYRRISESANQRISAEYLIGKHSGYHKWVLPKGLVEKGEGPVQAATREVEEEVGVRARVVELVPIKTIEYWYQADLDTSGKTTRRVKKYQEEPAFTKVPARRRVRVHKRVIFYLMELLEELPEHGWEMSERRWVTYEEGRELLALPSEKEVLESARALL